MEKLIQVLKERIMIGLQYDTISEGTTKDLLQLIEKMEALNIPVVIGCKHENEQQMQGDGFVYTVCADCGEDLD